MARTIQTARQKLANATRPLQTEGQQVLRSGYTGRQPIHPIALLKQQKRGARGFSSSASRHVENVVRQFFAETESQAARYHAKRFPSTNVGRKIAQSGGRAPWACTLRPNLTGGAMPRTAGGYSIGGGARYFSHGPAAPAQVVQNVSQAMRAFFLSGQKLRYDGVNARGQRQYKAVSTIEDEAMRKLASIPRTTPGAYIDFQLSPTLTALGPLAAVAMISGASSFTSEGLRSEDSTPSSPTLNGDGFLDLLSADFARALKDLQVIQADLKRLSVLGDLPIELLKDSVLRVRFPGVDARMVQNLCDDIEIQRGIVAQDPDFDAFSGASVALKFPFAPDTEKTITSPGGSAMSLESYEKDELFSLAEDDSFVQDELMDHLAENPWFSESDDTESFSPARSHTHSYEGVEGVYRFLEECDRAKGRLG